MRTRHVFAISIAIVALVGATACSSDDSTTATTAAPTTAATGTDSAACPEAEGATVGYSEPLPDPNFQILEAVISDELAKAGATLMPVNANLDPGKQIGDITTLQQQGIDALIVNPVDPNAVQGAIADVTAAGIPVIAQDTEVGGPYFTAIQSDSGTAAADGAELMAAQVADGKVAVMVGPPFAEILERSRMGFEAQAAESNLNVDDTQSNQQITPDAARAIAEQWKQKYGSDLAGIWTFNDVSAIGVASTFDDTFKPVLISVNGQPDAIPLVEAGRITATYDLQTDMAGRALAFAALQAICGEQLPTQIWIGSKVIDSSNVADFVPPEERAEEPMQIELEERDGKTYVAGS